MPAGAFLFKELNMNDIYTRITDKIITELDAGTVPWLRPWTGGDDPFPRNALSQRAYRGINTILLGMEANLQGYQSNQWLTFRQANQLGGHVRKGETSSMIIWYELKMVDSEGDDFVAAGKPVADKRFFPLLKTFNVFNLDQVEGLPDTYQTPAVSEPDWDPCLRAEQIIERSGAAIRHSGFRAFYSPPNDLIYLPVKGSFKDEGSYYSTALHELSHWTGHATRVGRNLGRRFGESAYAMEELIAEMSSAFLSAHCRLEGKLQHASYIASWLEVLQRDKRAVFVAAAQAQKAADYLLERAGLIAPAEALPQAA
jgi:antirestriction protein ArdC